MATPKETIWECAPHTRAKHLILEKYLQAWFPILAKYNGRIIYMDGFAGPGEYKGGERGSPLTALDVARKHAIKLESAKVSFLFVESDARRAEHLKSILSKAEIPSNFEIETVQAEFKDKLKDGLDNLDKSNLKNAPIFAFVDPFGFSGVPYNQIKRLLKYPKTEVFVFFARSSVNRFLEQSDVTHHMKELFGMESIDIPKGPNRLSDLKELYENRLKEAANFVGAFTMLDDKGKPIYDLFFASNSPLGYVKMKEAMWAVDETGGFRFSDKIDPSQVILFKHDPIPPLVKLITDGGNHRKDIEIDKIETYVCNKTIYLSKHMKAALKQMEENRQIIVHPLKVNNQKRMGKSFASGTIIDFV